MTAQGRIATFVVLSLFVILYCIVAESQSEIVITPMPVEAPQVSVSIEKTELPVIEVDAEDFLVEVDLDEFECMRLNMYYEARNQRTDDAFIAVGYTVLNRVEDQQYPDSVCEVITQARRDKNGAPIRHKCQFSWYCDGKGDTPNLNNPIEQAAWDKATKLAIQVLRREVDNPVGNAVMYHATYVSPHWKKAYSKVIQIESHIFYSKV